MSVRGLVLQVCGYVCVCFACLKLLLEVEGENEALLRHGLKVFRPCSSSCRLAITKTTWLCRPFLFSWNGKEGVERRKSERFRSAWKRKMQTKTNTSKQTKCRHISTTHANQVPPTHLKTRGRPHNHVTLASSSSSSATSFLFGK